MTSVKFVLDQEIRRLAVKGTPSIASLRESVVKLFPSLQKQQFALSWTDEEGDAIQISSDAELEEALKFASVSGAVMRFNIRSIAPNNSDTGSTSTTTSAAFDDVVHEHVTCDECKMYPIRGIRYKCTVREDYDMCAACEAKNVQPYPVIKITDPRSCTLGREWGGRCGGNWRRGMRHGPPHGPPHGPFHGPFHGPGPFGHPWGGPHPPGPHHGPHPHGPSHAAFDQERQQRKSERCGKKFDKLKEYFEPVLNAVYHTLANAEPVSSPEKPDDKEGKNEEVAPTEVVEVEMEMQDAIHQSLAENMKLPQATEVSQQSASAVAEPVLLAQPAYVQTATPAVTNLPKPALRFIKDVNYLDGTKVQPGSQFRKIWQVRNDGVHPWPEGCNLVCAGGDIMCDLDLKVPLPVLLPNQNADISMFLNAPEKSGLYQAFFRAQTPDEQNFGQRLWVTILVTEPENEWDMITTQAASPKVEAPAAVGEIKSEPLLSSEIASAPIAPDQPAVTTEQPAVAANATSNGAQQLEHLWRRELKILADMGFFDTDMILPLLQTHLNIPISVSGEANPRYEGLQMVIAQLLEAAHII